MSEKIERRAVLNGINIETREDGSSVITGIGVPYDTDSVDFGFFVERYAEGCVTRTLRERPDVRVLVDHDTGKIVGRTIAGNFRVWEESGVGLRYELNPPPTTDGRDLEYNVKNKIITGVSAGFNVREEKWEKIAGKNVRTLLDIDLWELSFVAFPAYLDTSAEMRAILSGISERSINEIWEAGQAELPSQEEPVTPGDYGKRKIQMLKSILCP